MEGRVLSADIELQFHEKFVNKSQWIDEQVFQELFSIVQSLSGPASTKMLYCINLIRGGFAAAVFSFLLWRCVFSSSVLSDDALLTGTSLPGAIGMYGLALGVASIGDTLPRPVYALLSGLNSATVGVIALAAVELSEKAITDPITRIIVFVAASAGMLYNALWYFPVLMVIAGFATLVFDFRWLHRPIHAVGRAAKKLKPSKRASRARRVSVEDAGTSTGVEQGHELPERRSTAQPQSELPTTEKDAKANESSASTAENEPRVIPREMQLDFSWKTGTVIIVSFFLSFIVAMVLRSVLPAPTPLLYRLFSNMYLAGTIIFGGGPVVIPLLREYVVAEGWVSPRDFLIGLALIQAFPGPNFNFAVFLGALTAINDGRNSAAGALIAWVAIFSPGLILVHGTMGLWSAARNRRWVKALLRGINAGAVGLIYTAVYRIWQIGYIDEGFQFGRSLGDDPWWVVVVATSYVGGRWFKVPAPAAIMLGAVLGLIRYAVVVA